MSYGVVAVGDAMVGHAALTSMAQQQRTVRLFRATPAPARSGKQSLLLLCPPPLHLPLTRAQQRRRQQCSRSSRSVSAAIRCQAGASAIRPRCLTDLCHRHRHRRRHRLRDHHRLGRSGGIRMCTLSTRAFREQTCAVRTASAYTALAGLAASSWTRLIRTI